MHPGSGQLRDVHAHSGGILRHAGSHQEVVPEEILLPQIPAGLVIAILHGHGSGIMGRRERGRSKGDERRGGGGRQIEVRLQWDTLHCTRQKAEDGQRDRVYTP